MTFPDFDPWAPFDDDLDDEPYTPRHARNEQRKPMNTAIKYAVRFVTFTALAYAGVWLLWQFVILLNAVTTQVWK
jgi:hypothetical protein